MFVLALITSYLLGSVPFGLLLGFLAGTDIRQHGSKNIGATNVFRVCGKKLGILAFFLDFLKGLVPTVWLWQLSGDWPPAPYAAIFAGIAAVLGHNFPIWLKFRGGKGVATSAGVVAGLMWLPFVIAFTIFIIVVAVFHYISIGSMLASVSLVIAVFFTLPDPLGTNLPLFVLAVLLCIMLIFRHRNNIERILNGTENRFPPPRA